MSVCAKKAIVSGKVQGVFYRATTREKALSLNLNGYAKNLPDGSVEVLAQGEITDIESLMTWLWKGSPASDVTSVHVSDASTNSDLNTFTTG